MGARRPLILWRPVPAGAGSAAVSGRRWPRTIGWSWGCRVTVLTRRCDGESRSLSAITRRATPAIRHNHGVERSMDGWTVTSSGKSSTVEKDELAVRLQPVRLCVHVRVRRRIRSDSDRGQTVRRRFFFSEAKSSSATFNPSSPTSSAPSPSTKPLEKPIAWQSITASVRGAGRKPKPPPPRNAELQRRPRHVPPRSGTRS